jgi:hypothetical protein
MVAYRSSIWQQDVSCWPDLRPLRLTERTRLRQFYPGRSGGFGGDVAYFWSCSENAKSRLSEVINL